MAGRPGTADPLPAARPGSTTYRVAVVCLGNICRSPTAEVVLTAMLREAGLGDVVAVVSAGTGDWHVGEPMDRRAAAVLTSRGYDPEQHRAQQFEPAWFDELDLVLTMDEGNRADLSRVALGGDGSRVRMFRDFDPRASAEDRDVPDPWYGEDDGFDTVLGIVERTSRALVAALREELVEG